MSGRYFPLGEHLKGNPYIAGSSGATFFIRLPSKGQGIARVNGLPQKSGPNPMRHTGGDPFQRPMRPDRVDAIRLTAEQFAVTEPGFDMVKDCATYADFQRCIAFQIFDAMGEVWPDTMVAEIVEGLDLAAPACRASYTAWRAGMDHHHGPDQPK